MSTCIYAHTHARADMRVVCGAEQYSIDPNTDTDKGTDTDTGTGTGTGTRCNTDT